MKIRDTSRDVSPLIFLLMALVIFFSCGKRDGKFEEDVLIRKGNRYEKLYACMRLKKNPRPASIAALLEAVKDEDADINRVAIQALMPFKSQNIGDVFVQMFPEKDSATMGLLSQWFIKNKLPSTVKSMISYTQHESAVVRQQAIYVLSELGDKSALPSVRNATNDTEPDVQVVALAAWAKLTNKRDPKLVIELVKSPNPKVSKRALKMLMDMEAEEMLLNTLSGLLKSPDIEQKQRGMALLVEMHTKGAVEILLEALSDAEGELQDKIEEKLSRLSTLLSFEMVEPLFSNEQSRVHAARLMEKVLNQPRSGLTGYLRTNKIKTFLISHASDKSPEMRKTIAQIIGNFNDEQGIKKLGEMSRDKSPEVRMTVAKKLGNFRTQDSDKLVDKVIAALAEMTTDSSLEVRQSVVSAFKTLGEPKSIKHLGKMADDEALKLEIITGLEEIISALAGNVVRRDEFIKKSKDQLVIAVKTLNAKLEDENQKVKLHSAYALRALSEILPEYQDKAVTALLDFLDNPGTLDKVVAELLNSKSAKTVSPLLDKLKTTGDTALKNKIAQGLGYYKKNQPKVFAQALELAQSDDENLRLWGIYILGYLGDEKAISPLIEILQNDRSVAVRKVCSLALANFKSEDIAEPLLQAMNDEALAIYSQRTLEHLAEKFEHKRFYAFLANPDAKIRLNAAKVLANLDDEKSINPLKELLKETDQSIREEAIRTLGRFDSSNTADAISEMLQDEIPGVRVNALETLAGVTERKSKILKDIGKLVKDADATVRETVATVIVMLGEPNGASYLVQMLDDKEDKVLIEVIKSLGKFKDKNTVSQLINLLGREKPIRLSVLSALDRIASLEAAASLRKLLTDEDAEIQQKAFDVLINIEELS